jgi:hypothetical protein
LFSRATEGAEGIFFLCFLRPWNFLRLLRPTLNRPGPSNVSTKTGGWMSFLNKLLGKSETPKQRVQVCVECGMPVADHKQWCSILQGQNELKLKAEKKSA